MNKTENVFQHIDVSNTDGSLFSSVIGLLDANLYVIATYPILKILNVTANVRYTSAVLKGIGLIIPFASVSLLSGVSCD